MISEYSPQEILRIAIKVEDTGEKLYTKLEYEALEEKLKSVWDYLAQQELKHKKVFQEMLDKAGDYIVDNFNPGEYQNYINALASEYIFTPQLIERKIQEGFPNNLAAIKFGIDIEKESIIVYSLMKEFVQMNRHSTLDQIIKEEQGHLAMLITYKNSMKKGER